MTTFVNSHAESNSRNHDALVGFHEVQLNSLALFRWQTGVVGLRVHLISAQGICDLIGVLLQGDIDNGRASPFFQDADQTSDLVSHVLNAHATRLDFFSEPGSHPAAGKREEPSFANEPRS